MSWRDSAACKGLDTETYFYGQSSKGGTDIIERCCGACAVIEPCLTFAMEREAKGRRFGVWGGTTPTEREILASTLDIDGCAVTNSR